MGKICQEWKGTIIEIINKTTRVELRVDGKTQDYAEGLVVPKGKSIQLEAKSGWRDKICVVFERNMIGLTKYTIYFNKKKIRSGLVTINEKI